MVTRAKLLVQPRAKGSRLALGGLGWRCVHWTLRFDRNRSPPYRPFGFTKAFLEACLIVDFVVAAVSFGIVFFVFHRSVSTFVLWSRNSISHFSWQRGVHVHFEWQEQHFGRSLLSVLSPCGRISEESLCGIGRGTFSTCSCFRKVFCTFAKWGFRRVKASPSVAGVVYWTWCFLVVDGVRGCVPECTTKVSCKRH